MIYELGPALWTTEGFEKIVPAASSERVRLSLVHIIYLHLVLDESAELNLYGLGHCTSSFVV